jgi:hypothetical protein
MASFPTSVKTYATRNNGDTIQASHVNELGDEITAIEDGYRNATAPLNSSKSTVATLSVAGGSTFTGDVTMSGELFVTKSPPITVARTSSAVAIPNAAYTAIDLYINDVLSTSTMHSTSSNPSRIIMPSSGIYHITGRISWSDFSTAGQRQLQIILNSTVSLNVNAQPAWPSTGFSLTQEASFISVFQANDYVELRAYQDSGSTGSLSNVSFSPTMQVAKIR